jgi:hypothetical protein
LQFGHERGNVTFVSAPRTCAAVVVLPSTGAGRLMREAHRRWLGGPALRVRTGEEHLLSALSALGLPPPSSGLAALRLWGQTGERPEAWLAAADPVYLEPVRDRLSVHALGPRDVPRSDLRPLFEHLQATVAEGRPYAFELVDGLAYFRSSEPVATAAMSAANVPGEVLGGAMVEGEGAAAHDALQSEVQMSLHDAGVNRRRLESGLPPVNGLWLWGGGRAAPAPRELPDLYGDDPLFVGYWHSALSPVRPWPGSLSACLRASPGGFVAVTPRLAPAEAAAVLDRELGALRGMLLRRRLHRATLLFRDGLGVDARWPDAWRFWRRRGNPVLEPHGEPD